MHALFIGVLVFSVRWQNRPAEPVTAELYAPPLKVAEPKPEPKPPPKPPPEPKVAPPVLEPLPVPPPLPPPPALRAPPRDDSAEIALKAKQEQERRQREEAARKEAERKVAEKREQERKEAERKAAEKREQEEAQKRKAEEQRLAEARERQEREAEALKAAAEREREQADRERQARVEAQRRAEAQARADAFSRAQADYIARIQQKVRGNVVLPPDLAGNPEAIFDVVQLPTGEIIDVTLKKSSGVRAYDEAVQRAILKSSPLPRPDRADIFQRMLTLKFRPKDS